MSNFSDVGQDILSLVGLRELLVVEAGIVGGVHHLLVLLNQIFMKLAIRLWVSHLRQQLQEMNVVSDYGGVGEILDDVVLNKLSFVLFMTTFNEQGGYC